jgi:hypothetical protein
VYKLLVKYGFLFLWGSLIVGCADTTTPEREIVAEVGVKKLYLDEVTMVIPTGVGKNDSAVMSGDYIRKWIKKELLIQKAEENLSPLQKNLSAELEEYRNSLIIYKYKNELMKQRMDTVVKDEQIEEYYFSNPENFNLTQNIVKAIFIKIPGEFANPQQIKNLCSDTSEEGLNELREYCLQYAKGFDIFMDNWVNFDVVLKNIPQEIPNPGQFLARNNRIELNDSDYYYLVSIHDFKLINEKAPVEYVKENIKNLILNRRKIDFLKQIEDNVYTEGIRKNKFKIHETE